MPTISFFFGIVVQMYWPDHPLAMSTRTIRGSKRCSRLRMGKIIAGSFPPRATRLVSEWIELRRPELMANWERAKLRDPLLAPGADQP